MLHRKLPSRIKGYGDHIEAHRHIQLCLLKIVLRCFNHFLLLGVVHMFLRQGNHPGAAGLDLTEYQTVPIPGNQVQLSEPALEIGFQNPIALFDQVAFCGLFSLYT